MRAWIEGHAAHLEWYATLEAGVRVRLERQADDGGWRDITELIPDGTGRLTYEDHDLIPGHVYDYRLRLSNGAQVQYAGMVTLSYAPPGLVFRAYPNPAKRGLRFTVGLPGGIPSGARIDVFDVTGRQVLTEALDPRGANPFTLDLVRSGALRSGVYLARLMVANRSVASFRVAIVR